MQRIREHSSAAMASSSLSGPPPPPPPGAAAIAVVEDDTKIERGSEKEPAPQDLVHDDDGWSPCDPTFSCLVRAGSGEKGVASTEEDQY